MRRSNHPAIRALLRGDLSEGATASEIGARLGIRTDNVTQALQHMPDAYVDRWTEYKVRGQRLRVWCVVVPPPDCPHPDRET